MKKKNRWIDLALLPFNLCVLFLICLGKICGLTYKQISVVFNLWVQGAVLTLSGLVPFGITIYRLTEGVSIARLLLALLFFCYGMVYVYAFIKMLRHYHLPFDDAFDLCVKDLKWWAAKWHTTYHIVNPLFFILFFLILLGLNIYLGYSLYWLLI